MVHKPSRQNRQERSEQYLQYQARRYVLEKSFRDVQLAETICRTNSLDLLEEFQCCPFEVENGLILADSRGRGSFQK